MSMELVLALARSAAKCDLWQANAQPVEALEDPAASVAARTACRADGGGGARSRRPTADGHGRA
jgi:hypothetical protein